MAEENVPEVFDIVEEEEREEPVETDFGVQRNCIINLFVVALFCCFFMATMAIKYNYEHGFKLATKVLLITFPGSVFCLMYEIQFYLVERILKLLLCIHGIALGIVATTTAFILLMPSLIKHLSYEGLADYKFNSTALYVGTA